MTTRTAAIAGAAALVAVAAIMFFVLGGSDGDDGKASEEFSALPDADEENAEATLTYLDAEGAILLTVHEAAGQLESSEDPEVCRALGTDLDEQAPPDEVGAVIAGVPDEALRGGFFDEREALAIALSGCVTDQVDVPAAERESDLADARALVDARIEQLEDAQ